MFQTDPISQDPTEPTSLQEQQEQERKATDVKAGAQVDPSLKENVAASVDLGSAEIQREGTTGASLSTVAGAAQEAVIRQLDGEFQDKQKLMEAAVVVSNYVQSIEGEIDERINDRAKDGDDAELVPSRSISEWAGEMGYADSQEFNALLGAFENKEQMDEAISGIVSQIERGEAAGLRTDSANQIREGVATSQSMQLDKDLALIASLGSSAFQGAARELGINNGLGVDSVLRELDARAGLNIPGLDDGNDELLNYGRRMREMGVELPMGIPTTEARQDTQIRSGSAGFADLLNPVAGLLAAPAAATAGQGTDQDLTKPNTWKDQMRMAYELSGLNPNDPFIDQMGGLMEQFGGFFAPSGDQSMALPFSSLVPDPAKLVTDQDLRLLNLVRTNERQAIKLEIEAEQAAQKAEETKTVGAEPK